MEQTQVIIPCAIFSFNRPRFLKRVLNALVEQNVDRLIIFVDGPRDKRDHDAVKACQKIAENVNWTETELVFRSKNFGLLGILKNIDYVFSSHAAAVFIEDDCLPMPDFYAFMCQAIKRYKSNERIFSIGGYQPISWKEIKNQHFSVVGTTRFTCWGWSTWRNRWQAVRSDIDMFDKLFAGLHSVPSIAGDDLSAVARNHLKKNQPINSWDYRVSIASLSRQMIHLLPTRGLVRNIGIGWSGSHGSTSAIIKGKIFHNRNVYQRLLINLPWLDNMELDVDYIISTQEFIRQVSFPIHKWYINRLIRAFKSKLKISSKQLSDPKLSQNKSALLKKRALLSYLVHPLSISRADPNFLRHINIWHTRAIVSVLNEAGYAVDIVDYRDKKFIPQHQYDVFIGHGGINFLKISENLPDSTVRIYFSTGAYWHYHNKQEKKRFDDLEARRGVQLPLDRYIYEEEEAAISNGDSIITLGNSFTRNTYRAFPNVIAIENTTLSDNFYDWLDKDIRKGSKNFLYYAGKGCVHKGLDLLLEAFNGVELNLFVCTTLEMAFKKEFSRELFQLPNIQYVGWIQPRSTQYYNILGNCNYCVLPSASEGGAQSVIECMNQGLIPIVSKECGLDVDDCGFVLEESTISQIRTVIQLASDSSLIKLQELSRNSRDKAVSQYSELAFKENLEKALIKIIGSKHV